MLVMDTHKTYRTLIDGGFTEKQADTILKAVADGGSELATKKDLELTEARLSAGQSKLRTEMIIWQIGIGFAIVGVLKFLH